MNTAHPIRRSLTIILLIMSAVACGGSRQLATPAAPHLSAGVKELQKADAWYRKGCYPKALHHYRRAYPELVAGDHLQEMAVCLNNMGNTYLRTGKADSALVFFNEALDIDLGSANTASMRATLVNKTTALTHLGRYDAADAALSEARAAGPPAGPDAAPLLAADAVLQMRRGNPDAARALLAQAMTSVGDNDTATAALIHYSLGHLARSDGDLDAGMAHFEKALAADHLQGYYRGMADDLKAMGDIRATQDRLREAAGFYKRSISLYALIDAAPEADALRGPLAQAASASGQTTDVTLHFVNDWLGNKAFNGPCE
ncbi:MAG: tetratricopeptide repeat protein [Pseudomonadota bacterium]